MTTTRTIAFLGATGDCAGYCLLTALRDGSNNKCRALARTPSKLESSLRAKGISDADLSALKIIPGNAKNISDVKTLLKTEDGGADVVDTVVFAVGAAPKLRFHVFPVTLTDTTVCQGAMATVLTALAEMKTDVKPRLCAVSTTGITRGVRDVPLLYVPLYRWFLAVPHEDKRAMEDLVWEQKGKSDGRVIGDFIIVRPTLFGEGAAKGIEKVRVGVEKAPALGYFIARKDVGVWMYEKVVKPEKLDDFKDEAVSLTW